MDKKGKTTRLMERAVRELGDLPEGQRVYITGPHRRWLRELERAFKKAGLVDVVFFTPEQIFDGRMRGCRGKLLIDDMEDFHWKDLDRIMAEKFVIEV